MDNPAINIISVCSGAGGLDLGVGNAIRLLGFEPRTVAYVEREAFACAVLAERMEAGDLDVAPIWTDLASFSGRWFSGYCGMVIAGLPCQPYSVAGKKLGADDERYLWPAFFDLLQTVRPAVVFLENVTGLLRFFEPIGQRLCAMGYEIEAGIFSAAEVGAPHRRERLFVLAHSDGFRRDSRWQRQQGIPASADAGKPMADACGKRWGGRDHGYDAQDEGEIQAPGSRCAMGDTAGEIPVWPPAPGDRDGWGRVVAMRPDLAPAVDGKLNPRFVEWLMGLPVGWTEIPGASRIDRLRALGNAVIPATAELAFRALWEQASWENG